MRKLEESDEELFRVPDMEAKKTIHDLFDENGDVKNTNDYSKGINTSSKNEGSTSSPRGACSMDPVPKRKRGRNPVDKELLRNRVSAQQARERKKVYVNDLEWRAKELEDHNSQLEESISTLVNENTMLRKILMNTRAKQLNECVETKI